MHRVIAMCKGLSNPRGGAQSAARRLFDDLRESSFDTFQIDFCRDPVSIFQGLSLLSQSSFGFIEWFYRSSRLIKKKFFNDGYDLAHIHCYGGFWISPPSPEKTIVTLHDEPRIMYSDVISPLYSRIAQQHLNNISSILRRKTLSYYPWIQALSNSVKNQLIELGYKKSRIRVIPHGFLPSVQSNPGDTRKEVLQKIGLKESDKFVLVVGSIDYRKGGYRILEACKILKETNSDIHLVLVGVIGNFIQESFARVLLKIKEKHRITNFHLAGFLPRSLLNGLLWNCDTYLSASYSETGPLSLMEAARFGVPIVATDVGIARAFFEGDVTILERNCSAFDIADGISNSIDKPRKQYSCVRKFTKNRMNNQLKDFYLYILENSQRR